MESSNHSILAIVGFGAQAKAWALNYRDSGNKVYVILRKNSSSIQKAESLGFKTLQFDDEEVKSIRLFAFLVPDDSHLEILRQLTGNLSDNSTIIYAHGYSFSCSKLSQLYPKYNHLLLAPKAIASEVRFRYTTKENIIAAFSLEAVDKSVWSKRSVSMLAESLGFNKLIETTFEEETKADLFSEQSLLCSLIPYGALHSYNKLRNKGVNKELAFVECWMEVLLIAKAMIEYGPSKLFDLISPNALIGGEKAAKVLFDESFHEKLNTIIEDVWSEKFYEEVEQTDYLKLKSKVIEYWNDQEIQSVYDSLKNDL